MKAHWPFAAALLIGMALGALPVYLYHRHRLRQAPDSWLFVQYTYRVIQDVDTLIELRRGETDDAVDGMERDLSTQIHDLSLAFPDKTLSDRASIRILKTASRYRSEHPFKTGDADKDRIVEELLARAQKKE